MFVTKIKSVLAVLVVGVTFGGIGAGNGLSTTPAAAAQQPGGLPGGPEPAGVGGGAGAPPASGPDKRVVAVDGKTIAVVSADGSTITLYDVATGKELMKFTTPKAKAKETDWRIRAIDDQVAELQELQKQAEKKAAAIESTIRELRAQRERFLKKPDALKRAELKQAESALEAAAAQTAAAEAEVAKAIARLEEAKANSQRARATYQLFEQALENLRGKPKDGMGNDLEKKPRQKSKEDKPPEPKKSDLDEKLQERLATLKTIVKLTTENYNAGRVSFDRVHQATSALLDVELELAASAKERIAVLEKIVALAKEKLAPDPTTGFAVVFVRVVTKAEPARAPQPKEAKEQTLKLNEPVQSMRWSRDGKVMASLSRREKEDDGKRITLFTFRLWDAKTGKLKHNLGELEYPGFGTFDLSPDGKFLAISSRRGIAAGDNVALYDTEKGTLLTTIEMEYGRSRPWFAFSPDNRTLAVCGFEPKEGKLVGTVRLFDTKKGDLKQRLFSHDGSMVLSVLFSPDGKSLAAGCHLGEITVWDMAAGKIKTKLKAAGPTSALAWSADGKLLASGGIDGGRVWDLATGKSRELKPALGFPPSTMTTAVDGESRIYDLTFSPDGSYIAGEGILVKNKKDDPWMNKILVWDTAAGEIRHGWLGLHGFAFTPDSKRLAILQDPKTVKLMDLTQEESPKGQADRTRIQGTWHVVAMEERGEGQPEDRFKPVKMRLVFKDDTLSIKTTGPDGKDVGPETMSFVLDEKASPKRIDISKGEKTIVGIYAFEDGKLKLCITMDGEMVRPAEFKTQKVTVPQDPHRRMFVLKKEDAPKPKGDEPPQAKKADDAKGPEPKQDESVIGGPQQVAPGAASIHLHAIVETVYAKKGTISVKGVMDNHVSSVMALSAVASGKKPAGGGPAKLLNEINPENNPKLVNVLVRANAQGVIGIGVGMAKVRLKMEDLKAGQVVALQLSTDRTNGLVITFVRVLSDERKE